MSGIPQEKMKPDKGQLKKVQRTVVETLNKAADSAGEHGAMVTALVVGFVIAYYYVDTVVIWLVGLIR